MRLVILLCLMVAPQLVAAAEDDAEVRKNLVGVWKGRVQDGATGHEITFATDSISGLKDGTRDLGKGSFQLDLTAKPWAMDAVEIKKDGKKGRSWLGIVVLKKDSLKWCVSSQKRPAKFATGDGNFCLVLKRQKGSATSASPMKPTRPAKTGNYKVAELAEAAPGVLSAKVRKTFSKSGLRITDPNGKVLGDIWLRVNVPTSPSSGPTDRKYPLESGTLLGAIRISENDAGDFRDLKIAPGVYTLRFGLQPTDDNHEYTKQFRDFVVLLAASGDTDPARISDEKDLSNRGIDTTGETHPAILYLKAPQKGRTNLPAMVRSPGTDGNTDLHVLVAKTTTKGNSSIRGIQIELVTVGYAKE
ncbi:MAG: hypothetical protein ACC628_15290 [Pirellulaceae bacterium]